MGGKVLQFGAWQHQPDHADLYLDFWMENESRFGYFEDLTVYEFGGDRGDQLVELIQVGDGYFVRDGHHRISVARALGDEYIEAEVTVWQVSQLLPEKWPVWPIVAQLPAMSPPMTAGNLDQSGRQF